MEDHVQIIRERMENILREQVESQPVVLDKSADTLPEPWQSELAEHNDSPRGQTEAPLSRDADPVVAETSSSDSDPTSVDNKVFNQIKAWAGEEPKQWGHLHNALLRIYAPRWERIDARDTLVAWTGAWLALTRAMNQLKRLQTLNRPLTRNELATKGGREADISFYGRLTKRLNEQISAALSNDVEAARLLAKLCSRRTGNEQ